MNSIERMMDLSRVLMKRYTEDDKGRLPVREVSKKVMEISKELKKNTSMTPRVILLNGLRGVGKTTILFQTMRSLLEAGIDEDDVLYFSMDRASLSGQTITDIIEMYESTVLKGHIASMDRTKFVLIDEAHYSPNWDLQIKTLADGAPNAVVIATCSSALQITTSADLARRSLLIGIPPLSFCEYLKIRTRNDVPRSGDPGLISSLFGADSADSAVRSYESRANDIGKTIRNLGGHSPGAIEDFIMNGGLPFSINSIDPAQQIYEMVRKVVEKDVPLAGEHDTSSIRRVPRLLGLISGSPDISLNTISRDIDGLSMTSTRALMDTLEKTGLIFEVRKTGGTSNVLRSDTRKYFITSSITSAIQSSMGNDPLDRMGPLIETAAVSAIWRTQPENPMMTLRYMKGKGLADLIIDYGETRVALEVGSGRKEGGPAQLKRTMARSNSDYGMLVSGRDELEIKDNIVMVPLREFLCIR